MLDTRTKGVSLSAMRNKGQRPATQEEYRDMDPLILAYRQRWDLREGEQRCVALLGPSIEVPVATAWSEREIATLAKQVKSKGFTIAWEPVACRHFEHTPRGRPGGVYVRFDSSFIDKDQDDFWQLSSPLAIEYFANLEDLYRAMHDDANSKLTSSWDLNSVLQFPVPWYGRFAKEPFTVNVMTLSESTVRLSQ